MDALQAGGDRAQVELHCLQVRDGFRVPDRILSEHEQQRAAAFRSTEARHLFTAGRFLCRHVLGNRLGYTPQTLSIAMTPSGRPHLTDHPDIDFNLSHTRDRVALAIHYGGRIGIDIERLDAFSEQAALEIMPMILSEDELNQVNQLEPRSHRDIFLACWVKKEAALKCLGMGFRINPQSVTFALDNTTYGEYLQTPEGVIFTRSGRFGDVETGIFAWSIATSTPVPQPIWHHHTV